MKKNYETQMKRIQAALEASKLDYEAMARRVGIKPESLRKAWKGYQGMGEPVLRLIESVAAEGMRYIAADEKAPRVRDGVKYYKMDSTKMRKVPIISRAQAGHMIQWEELLEEDLDYVSSDCPDPEAVALEVWGDSMEPVYRAGDVIIVMPTFKPVNESLVVVRLTSGDVMFKEIVFLDSAGERFKLLSYNPRYEAREVGVDEIEKAMPVYSVIRKVWDREKWQAQFDAMNGPRPKALRGPKRKPESE